MMPCPLFTKAGYLTLTGHAQIWQNTPCKVPYPAGWTSYKLIPDRMEFWNGMQNRCMQGASGILMDGFGRDEHVAGDRPRGVRQAARGRYGAVAHLPPGRALSFTSVHAGPLAGPALFTPCNTYTSATPQRQSALTSLHTFVIAAFFLFLLPFFFVFLHLLALVLVLVHFFLLFAFCTTRARVSDVQHYLRPVQRATHLHLPLLRALLPLPNRLGEGGSPCEQPAGDTGYSGDTGIPSPWE